MSTTHESAVQFFHEGSRLLAAGEFEPAEAMLRHAILLAPDLPEAHANLAYLFEETGHPEEAERCYRKALELAPENVAILRNAGSHLCVNGQPEEAVRLLRQAQSLAPADPGLRSGLGIAHTMAGNDREAERCYRAALALAPAHAKARFNLATLLLRHGRYDEGWQLFEARNWYAVIESRLDLPRWQGEQLAGKSLLIGCEAGHGDMIQFCRYAPLVKAAGAQRIGMLSHPALKTLLDTMPALDVVATVDEAIPEGPWDYWVPPLSLPLHFATRIDSIPTTLPYLQPPVDRTEYWQKRLAGAPTPRIGLVWKGNPRFENDRRRSLQTLDELRPILDLDGIHCFSLQKGAGEDEAARWRGCRRFTDLAPEIDDFSDLAAAIKQLDLIISVDTAAAHLAGALGHPCWILLPRQMTDWRWLEGRDDSPWYPGTARLFRQGNSGHWDETIIRVRQALEKTFTASAATQKIAPAE